MRILILAAAITLFGSMAYGDEVDQALSNMASERVMTNARQMIQAGINEGDTIGMIRMMIQNRFTENQTVRAQQIMLKAQQEGLPVGPIMLKANEGLAKQVQDSKIVQAMERVRSRYAFAYSHANALKLNNQERHALATTMCEGLAAGIGQMDMARIMERVQERTRNSTNAQKSDLSLETFKAARDMARTGVRSGKAADVVCEALQHSYSAQDMKTMRRSFMSNATRYSSPHALAESYSQGIMRDHSAGSLGGSGGSSGSGGSGGSAGSSGGSGGGGHGGGGGGGNGGGGH